MTNKKEQKQIASSRLYLRITPNQKSNWLKKAKEASLTLSEWVKKTLDCAS